MQRPFRQWLRRVKKYCGQPSQGPSRWDVWLSRAGAISTVTLAAVGVFTIWYTVVPLYKVAALDEQLSRKELELTSIQTQLIAEYNQLRKNSISAYIRTAGADCTGLMLPPEYKELAKAAHDPTGRQLAVFQAREPQWRQILTMDVKACLFHDFETSQTLRTLHTEDRAALSAAVQKITNAIDMDRRESLTRAEQLPTAATRNPNLVSARDEVVLDLLLKQERVSPTERERRLFERRIADAQFDTAMGWGRRTCDHLFRLIGNLKFPDNGGNEFVAPAFDADGVHAHD